MDAKLSVWTAYYVELSPEDAVLELKKHGINCAELSDEHGLMLLERGEPNQVGAAYRTFLEKENFTMTQGHLWLKVKLCTDPDAVSILKKWLTLYEAIGIENAVLHCDYIDNMPNLTHEERAALNLEKLLQLQAFIKPMRIRICLENLNRSFQTSEKLLTVIRKLDEDCFGVCLDTGHLNMNGEAQADFIRNIGSRLHALHIADNEGKSDQHMMPYGRGNVDFETVVRTLREIDYHGLFNLEIPGERFAPLPVRGWKLEYIRKCYDYLMQIP